MDGDIRKKSAEEIRNMIKNWLDAGMRPVEIIKDNGREFNNKKFRKMGWDYGIEHRLVGV